ncbi:RidA family protein [bacterium]|jgi:enamine deaminase RidA (YjgF/YER057c/UK114 family)|nr:RidA family protein [bacterium]
MTRVLVSSGSPFEERIGFSRAVRVGDWICVSGTAPLTENGETESPGDLYLQTLRCLEIIQQSIEEAGGQMKDVIRTRVLLTDASRWEEAARAHGAVFSRIRPASTFAAVSSLLQKDWLVEIEADCLVNRS